MSELTLGMSSHELISHTAGQSGPLLSPRQTLELNAHAKNLLDPSHHFVMIPTSANIRSACPRSIERNHRSGYHVTCQVRWPWKIGCHVWVLFYNTASIGRASVTKIKQHPAPYGTVNYHSFARAIVITAWYKRRQPFQNKELVY